jgi:methylated-DNA-[protein]-cysteine S-methyltransferase
MKFLSSTVRSDCATPLGRLILAAQDTKLTGIWFEGQQHQPDISAWSLSPQHPLLQQAQSQLSEYFAGQRQEFDLPLDWSCGTAFQQKVWRALLKIPFGASLSYGAISADIGQPSAVRAVGLAIGRNPFSIVVPCHRVLGKGGALTGYAGGIERKAALLRLEGSH